MNSSRCEAHVCLVSDQAIPNITPVLDTRLSPSRVILVVSGKSMEEKAARLSEILTSHGRKVEIEPLRSHEDFSMLREDFQRIARTHPDSALNATGGKKTMMLAAYEAFRSAERPVFYVEQNNTLQWLAFGSGKMELQSTLGLNEILDMHSQVISFAESVAVKDRLDLAARYFSEPAKFGPVLAELQFLGKEKEKPVSRKDGKPLGQNDVEALKAAKSAGLTNHGPSGWHATAEGARFLSGGWLEMHVFHAVQKIAPKLGIRDVCYGLKISSILKPDVKNEIDVAFVRNNQLHIVECKALKSAAKSKPATNFIYTLESVRKHGGLTAKSALLTWGASPGKADRERAENNRVRILAGETLSRLDLALNQWAGAT